MTILGIETSCDETAAALVENGTKLVAQALASSAQLHEKYRGIVPDHAAREQLKSILPVIHEVVDRFTLDAIAVTVGPGLIGSLLVGVETAKALSLAWNKPLIPVNHLVGHIYANWITSCSTSLSFDLPFSPPALPAIVLLVSGGHSELILMTDHQKYQVLGSTRDDAAGECFDKCGRLLGLPYPYGPFIEKLADTVSEQQLSASKIKLPRPLIGSSDLDFSFSGLKTAFLNELKKKPSLVEEGFFHGALAHELQEAITDVLVQKTLKAVCQYQPKSLILAGGVAANKKLREKIKLSLSQLNSGVSLAIPPISLCTDNAVYIASAAFYNNKIINLERVEAIPELTI